jgi:hypothetical protein
MTLSGIARRGIDPDARSIFEVHLFSLGFRGWIREQLEWAFEGELKGEGRGGYEIPLCGVTRSAGPAGLRVTMRKAQGRCGNTTGYKE